MHIGVMQSAAVQLLPGWIRRLRILHPDVAIKLYEGTSPEVTAWTLAGVVEVGITSGTHPDLNSRIIYEDDFVVVVPFNHSFATETSIGLKNLDGKRLLVSSDSYDILIKDQLAAAASHPEIVCAVRDNATLISMVREGLGLTVIPELALSAARRDGVQLIRLHPTLPHTIHALTKRHKTFEPVAMTFLGLVQSSRLEGRGDSDQEMDDGNGQGSRLDS
ncbi:LysR family transcriptional regulator substrate-binding protein [Rhodopila sp.]|uniref:LysR family transcriptional regulator substrate-binding protein n=1 Tax=Rhodopila sp. TaxID=2480087 RepID=UPI003D13E447